MRVARPALLIQNDSETENNLSQALTSLGERESSSEHLQQAITACNEAFKELTRRRVPLEWAATQNNLGTALMDLGERESGTARLEQAVAAFNAALKECTRERVPRNWATTQTGLGHALRDIGQRTRDANLICEALGKHVSAWKVFSDASYDATDASGGARKDIGVLEQEFPDTHRKCIDQHHDDLKQMGVIKN